MLLWLLIIVAYFLSIFFCPSKKVRWSLSERKMRVREPTTDRVSVRSEKRHVVSSLMSREENSFFESIVKMGWRRYMGNVFAPMNARISFVFSVRWHAIHLTPEIKVVPASMQ